MSLCEWIGCPKCGHQLPLELKTADRVASATTSGVPGVQFHLLGAFMTGSQGIGMNSTLEGQVRGVTYTLAKQVDGFEMIPLDVLLDAGAGFTITLVNGALCTVFYREVSTNA